VEAQVKQDHLFPTGSYKDRGAAVLVSKAHELGIAEVVEDSSGNAGCAIAAWCARAGIACQIYVPDSTSPAKTAQIAMYGAKLVLVPGSREDTARAVWAAAQIHYYASHSWNPFFMHGTKTWAFEVWEQLGWQSPDTVILPAGNGTLLLGAHIGFSELLRAGEIQRVPKIIAVQAENAAPLAQAFHEKLDFVPSIKKQDTLAEGIAIAEPARGLQILRAVRESGGSFLTVSEQEIAASLLDVCRQGAYIEPTAAATTAAAARYLRHKPDSERVITVFTGHGLKSTEKMLKIMAELNS
jgi:threonine synthase